MKKYLLAFPLLFLMTACGGNTTVSESETAADALTADAIVLTDMAPTDYDAIIKRYNDQGKAVLMNVWATWCGPCVEEFPHLVELREQYADQLEVVFISADFVEDKDKTLEFLAGQGVHWESYFKTGRDDDFINAIEESWGGALPFTKIYTPEGKISTFWENKADKETFEKAILEAVTTH